MGNERDFVIENGVLKKYRILEIHIPEGVTKIGDGVFYGCSYLRSVYLPDSVTEIAQDVF